MLFPNSMNRVEKAVFTLGLVAITTGAPALTSDNSYQVIAQRNVFALKSRLPDTNPPIKVELPNIKLQGITTILGRRQVLGKVLAKPPAKEESFVLSEGERQGEVEVVSIDEDTRTVTLKYGGMPMTLTMKDDAVEFPAAGVPVAAVLPGPPPFVSSVPPIANPPPQPSGMSAEEAEVAIEVKTRLYQQKNDVRAPIMPRTRLRDLQ